MVHPARFHTKALQAIRTFPKAARTAIGDAVLKLQYGARLQMPLSRPMPSVAPGVYELRVRDESGIYRAFYFLKLGERVLVFHAFVKKTQKTPEYEIELARRRLREVLYEEGENHSHS